VYLKDGLNEQAYQEMQKAYLKAVNEDQFNDDQVRFKV
jgi:hypothetical protein